MNINVQLLSNMRENTNRQKLYKVCRAQFECDKDHDLYFYLLNGFSMSSVKRLCDLGVIKYNKPTDNFFVDWDKYHEAKATTKSSKPISNKSKPKLQFNTSSLICWNYTLLKLPLCGTFGGIHISN